MPLYGYACSLSIKHFPWMILEGQKFGPPESKKLAVDPGPHLAPGGPMAFKEAHFLLI